jgi:hypothetical protein
MDWLITLLCTSRLDNTAMHVWLLFTRHVVGSASYNDDMVVQLSGVREKLLPRQLSPLY